MKRLEAQSYKAVEVILVDDGSTTAEGGQGLSALCDKFIRLHKNQGPGAARRIGRQHASGEFIVYLDCDDWWSPNFIQECVLALKRNPKCGMAYTNTIRVANDRTVSERVTDKIPDRILPSLFQKRYWSTPSAMWRREVSLAEFWQSYRDHEDFLHEVACAQVNNNIVFVDKAHTYNNISAEGRSPRCSDELLRSLSGIIALVNNEQAEGLFTFVFKTLVKRGIRLDSKWFSVLNRAVNKDGQTKILRKSLCALLYSMDRLKIAKGRRKAIQVLEMY